MNSDVSRAARLKWAEAWDQCQRHLHHLHHALAAVQAALPLTAQRLRELDDEAVQDWDQLILRLTKLQDTMGSRLFAATLEVLQEPYDDRPMIDRLNRLEKLGYLASVEEWQRLRVIRNRFDHDYPEDDALKAAYLNEAAEAVQVLARALGRFAALAVQHGQS